MREKKCIVKKIFFLCCPLSDKCLACNYYLYAFSAIMPGKKGSCTHILCVRLNASKIIIKNELINKNGENHEINLIEHALALLGR